MRKQKRRLAFFLFLDFVLVPVLAILGSVAARTSPPSPPPTEVPAEEPQTSTEAQSVAGTIASVGKKSFTLTIASAISAKEQSQQTNPKTMIFLMDKNTTIDGQLRVGASVNVTYREDNGNNVAINVRVPS
jgi:hypothetical protein